MRSLLAILIIAWFTSASDDALSSEITRTSAVGTTVILVKGRIELGDEAKFAIVAEGISSAIVLLDSEGGYLAPAIRIGRQIREKRFATWVATLQGQCASACGFIWLAGMPRMMDNGSLIGFHAAYTIDNGAASITGSGNALAGAYMRELGLGDDAIGFLTAARPEGMQWLTEDAATRLGIAVARVPMDPPEQKTLRSNRVKTTRIKPQKTELQDLFSSPAE